MRRKSAPAAFAAGGFSVIDPLDSLWPLMESPGGVFRSGRLERWPDGVALRLQDLGFLISAGASADVICPECRNHVEEVVVSESPHGVRFFIGCPEHIRVEVTHEDRLLWTVNSTSVATALASSLRLTGKSAVLLPERCWRLGRTHLRGELRDVLLVRGIKWKDAESIRGYITGARKPIVFVPSGKPAASYWLRRVPPVLALDQVATLGPGGIEIDPLEIMAAIQDAEVTPASDGIPVTTDQLTVMIRRQIKAEHRTELTDAVFLAAYRQEGSVRKAAEFLTQRTHVEVTKDQVFQAVKRAGGAAEVLNAKDSDSVVRPVASRSRDKKGKPLIRSQTDVED